MKRIEVDLNKLEAELRKTPEYHGLLAYDIESIEEFRKAGGFGTFPKRLSRDKTRSADSATATSNASFGSVAGDASSHSLSPVPESPSKYSKSSSPGKSSAFHDDDESVSVQSAAASKSGDEQSDDDRSQPSASARKRLSETSPASGKRYKSDVSDATSRAAESRTLGNTHVSTVESPLSFTPNSAGTESVFDNDDGLLVGKRLRGSFGGKRQSVAAESLPLRSSRSNGFGPLSASTIKQQESVSGTDEE
jgi:hypothetical protein